MGEAKKKKLQKNKNKVLPDGHLNTLRDGHKWLDWLGWWLPPDEIGTVASVRAWKQVANIPHVAHVSDGQPASAPSVCVPLCI